MQEQKRICSLSDANPQSLDKASGKEVLIRNDGVYVISGIFREQMPCKKVKARRAEVPSTRSAQARNTAQAKRRAVRNGKIHSRPDCWPSKPAKRCVDKQSGNFARKPQVCQRSEAAFLRRPFNTGESTSPRSDSCLSFRRAWRGPSVPASWEQGRTGGRPNAAAFWAPRDRSR